MRNEEGVELYTESWVRSRVREVQEDETGIEEGRRESPRTLFQLIYSSFIHYG